MNDEAALMQGYLRHILCEMGLEVPEKHFPLFGKFFERMLEYNRKVNLTRIVDPAEVASKHFADSLTLMDPELFKPCVSVVDVGTGAGFPGIPIAIVYPDVSVTLMDSLRKRTVFLAEVVEQLGLSNAKVVWSRAEDAGRSPQHREKHDVVLARAVASLNVLAELCLPMVKRGGWFIAMKGPKADEELALARTAIARLGGETGAVVSRPLPPAGDLRTLIKIRKVSATPPLYPRKPGIPEKQPLV